jgi:hypothetical protein
MKRSKKQICMRITLMDLKWTCKYCSKKGNIITIGLCLHSPPRPQLLSKLEPRFCRNTSQQTELVELTAYQLFIDVNQQHNQVYNNIAE